MGWVNPHITRKVWENTKIQKLRVSYMFHMKQKAIKFPKHGISEFLYHGSSMVKNRQFPHCTYLSDLELMKTLNVWESKNSHNLEMFCGKPYHFQVVVFWGNMGIFFPSSCKIDGKGSGGIFLVNTYNTQNMGNLNLHIKERYGKAQTFWS